jgi:5'-deoxy-5'-methylthioadenosine phosphorylase
MSGTTIIGIIGGTGLQRLRAFESLRSRHVSTPYGEPSGACLYGRLGDGEAWFLNRHGSGHTILPHEVNYRANLWALAELGANHIVAINSVGGIAPDLPPAALAIPDQIIDYTWGRAHTIFDGAQGIASHVEFAEPFSAEVRQMLLGAAAAADLEARDGGVYGATQGPRLETRAEIERMARDGCHMVGMTGMPEAALARELGLAYACCAVVINWAAGCGATVAGVHAEIEQHIAAGMDRASLLLQHLLESQSKVDGG